MAASFPELETGELEARKRGQSGATEPENDSDITSLFDCRATAVGCQPVGGYTKAFRYGYGLVSACYAFSDRTGILPPELASGGQDNFNLGGLLHDTNRFGQFNPVRIHRTL